MKKLSNTQRRAQRVRSSLSKVANGRHRLSVFRSSQNIYAQIIDDSLGATVVSASTLDSSLRQALKTGGNIEAAAAVGKLVAERAKKANVDKVVFDRGASVYHGRIKALADAAREGGLDF